MAGLDHRSRTHSQWLPGAGLHEWARHGPHATLRRGARPAGKLDLSGVSWSAFTAIRSLRISTVSPLNRWPGRRASRAGRSRKLLTRAVDRLSW